MEKITQLFLDDAMPIEMVKEKSSKIEARRVELHRFLANAEEPPPALHPEMATFYREQVNALYEALQGDTEVARLEAAAALRSLIKDIVLAPEGRELKIGVRGDLAGILTVALNKKRPSEEDGRFEQVKMVAGTRIRRVGTCQSCQFSADPVAVVDPDALIAQGQRGTSSHIEHRRASNDNRASAARGAVVSVCARPSTDDGAKLKNELPASSLEMPRRSPAPNTPAHRAA